MVIFLLTIEGTMIVQVLHTKCEKNVSYDVLMFFIDINS